MTTIYSHKDLIVWQKSIDLTLEVYKLTEGFPKDERYGLTSQLRRAAVSIPSNIAEGRYRSTKKDYVHFLRIALGSTAEIETQIVISKRFAWLPNERFSEVDDLLSQVGKMLCSMITKLAPRTS